MKTTLGLSASALALCLVAGQAMALDEAFYKEAGANFDGVTLRIVTESTPASNYVRDVIGPRFSDLTGIGVEIETTSWDQMYDKSIKDMEAGTGIYDAVYVEQDIVYAYLVRDFLVNITQTLKDKPELKAPDFAESNLTSFVDYFRGDGGDLFGMPMEAFIKTYVYRSDLFEDPEIQAAFKEQTGRDLAPATTHEEYAEIALFFTQWGKDNGIELWGTTAQAHTGHPASFYALVETIGPTFGLYNWGLNADENYAATVENGGRLNSPEAKEAMNWFLQMRDLAPPESVQSTWSEVATTMAAGRAAQGFVYGENIGWIGADETKSRVVGKISAAMPPLSEGVLEAAEGGIGYVGYYDGGAFAIPVTSRNQDAAILFLEFTVEEDLQPAWAVAGSRITTTATYDAPEVKELDATLNGYFTMMKEEGHLFAGAPPFPFHAQLREALAPIFYEILTGTIPADEGMDQMAERAEQELTDLGYRQ